MKKWFWLGIGLSSLLVLLNIGADSSSSLCGGGCGLAIKLFLLLGYSLQIILACLLTGLATHLVGAFIRRMPLKNSHELPHSQATCGVTKTAMKSFEEAVAEVEHRAGGTLPDDYREWLRQYQPGPSDHRQTPYGLDDLIKTQRLLQDAIPPGHLAIGDDGYGNAVLLRFSDGSIEWWSHESKPDDTETETIRPSFEAFLELIAEGEV